MFFLGAKNPGLGGRFGWLVCFPGVLMEISPLPLSFLFSLRFSILLTAIFSPFFFGLQSPGMGIIGAMMHIQQASKQGKGLVGLVRTG